MSNARSLGTDDASSRRTNATSTITSAFQNDAHAQALYRIALLIIRSGDLKHDLPDIVAAIRDHLDLDAVSILLQNFGIVVHSDHDDIARTNSDNWNSSASDSNCTADLESDRLGRPTVRVPVFLQDEPAGFVLVRTRSSDQPDTGLIELLGKLGNLVAERLEKDHRWTAIDGDSTQIVNVGQLLGILSLIASLGTLDGAVQPLLVDIAALLGAERVSLVAPDPLKPRLFTNRPATSFDVDDELLRLIALPAIRQALNSGRLQFEALARHEHRIGEQSSLLAAPLIAQHETVGVLVVERQGARPFTVSERESASALAHHFSYCLERESRVHAHSRQNLLLALVERVTAFIARSTNADDFLALTVQEIRRTFGYDCSIAMIAGERLIFQGIDLGDPAEVPGWIDGGIPLESGIMGRVADSGVPEFVRNVRSDPAFIDTGRNTISEIAVPIRTSADVVGVLNVESGPENPLRGIDYEILLVIANHVGIALSNRSLITSERETRAAIEAIQRVSTIVAETLDPDESLRRIASTLGDSLGYPIVSLALLDGRTLDLRAHYGYEPESFPCTMSIEHGIAGRVVRTGLPVLLEDVSTDADYVRECADMTSEVCVPIRCNGEIFGILNVEGTRERPVTRRDLHLLTTFAEHAGVLLNNARAYAELSREATLDPMTGVPNLRFFQQELRDQIQHMRRAEKPLSLAVIDLDDLKEINDTHGHLVGNQVLRALAQRLSQQLRAGDVLARYAGDEFVAIFPGVGETSALDVAQRLLATARDEPFEGVDGSPINLSVSIGVAAYPQDAATSTELMHVADMAMYDAKESGKNRVNGARRAAKVRRGSDARRAAEDSNSPSAWQR